MAWRTKEGSGKLRKVFETPVLFFTTRGKAGSPIHHTLGAAVAFAPGIASVVFGPAGPLFALAASCGGTSLSVMTAQDSNPEREERWSS